MADIFQRLAVAVIGAMLMCVTPAAADQPDVTGVWQQIDPDTHQVGSYVTIKQAPDGTYEGIISKLFFRPGDPPNPTCDGCKGEQKGHPFLGLKLMWGLKREGLTYDDGTIVDPRDGSEYNVTLTLSPDGNTLTVRGYVGIELFGQSLEWKRLTDPEKLSELEKEKTEPEKRKKKPKEPKAVSHKPAASSD